MMDLERDKEITVNMKELYGKWRKVLKITDVLEEAP